MNITELLIKVQREPGLCSKDEINNAYWWLLDFRNKLELYKSACGEPAGLSVHSLMDKLEFYRNREK